MEGIGRMRWEGGRNEGRARVAVCRQALRGRGKTEKTERISGQGSSHRGLARRPQGPLRPRPGAGR